MGAGTMRELLGQGGFRMRSTSLMRLLAVAGVLIAAGVLVWSAPASAVDRAQTDTESECPEGEFPDGAGGCVKACADGSEPKEGTCPPVAPDRCPDGSEPKDGTCPESDNPCPPGQDVCGQIRSCPLDTPLPPGGTCEQPAAVVPDPEPVAPGATPDTGGSIFGRPGTASGAVPAPTRRAVAKPAPVRAVVAGATARREQIARTGPNDDLVIGGFALIAAGGLLLGASRRRFA